MVISTHYKFIAILACIFLIFTVPANSQWTKCLDKTRTSEDSWDAAIKKGGSAIYYKTYYNLYKSTDNGLSWNSVFAIDSVQYALIQDFYVSGNEIWTVGRKSIASYFLNYSDDGGISWQELTPPINNYNDVTSYNGTLFLGTHANGDNIISPVYKSLDNGITWQSQTSNGLPLDDRPWAYSFWQFQGKLFCYFNPDMGAYVTDDGVKWEKCNNQCEQPNQSMWKIQITPIGFTIAYALDTYVLENGEYVLNDYQAERVFTVDGSNWKREKTLRSSEFYEKHFQGYNNNWLKIRNGYIVCSTDQGMTWQYWHEGLNINISQLYVIDNIAFAVQGGVMYRRSLSEIPSPPIPVLPILGESGGDETNMLLEFFGVDSPEELPADAIEQFLEVYTDNEIWDSPEQGMQPGTCSLMGMPIWKINSANLQLHISDNIFSTKSLGPNPEIKTLYNKNLPLKYSSLGKYWSLSYDIECAQTNDTIKISSGSMGVKTFISTDPITTGTTIAEKGKPLNSLNFDGARWHYFKHAQRITYHFSNYETGLFLLDSISDPEKNTLRIERNSQKQITAIIDAAGREITFSYLNGQCNGFVLPDGRNAEFDYNTSDLLSSTTDLNEIMSNYTYNSQNNIDTLDINGKITSFVYGEIHGHQRVISAINQAGEEISYQFTPLDSVTSISSITAHGVTKSYTNNNGTTNKVVSGNGQTAQRSLNSDGLPDQFSGKNNNQYQLIYNNNKLPISLQKNGIDIMQLEWDNQGNIISKTNLLGNTWNYTYDSFQRITTITSPENRITTFTYHPTGLLKSIQKGQLVTAYDYDEYGNVISKTHPNGGQTIYTYTPNGYLLESITSPEGRMVSLAYDNNQRPVAVSYNDDTKTTLNYDCCAQVSKTDENDNTVFVNRTPSGLISEYIDEEGAITTWKYDNRNQPRSKEDDLGNITEYKYGLNNLISSITDGERNTINYAYNIQNKLVYISDGNGNETSFLRNNDGQLAGIVYQSGDTILYTLDAIGQITKVTNARKQAIAFEYDKDGNPISKTYLNNTEIFSWDASSGQLSGYGENGNNTTYERDASGFINKIIYPNDMEISFEYDFDGNQKKVIYPNNFIVSKDFSSRNRIAQITWENQKIDLSYDKVGNIQTEERNINSRTLYQYTKTNKIRSVSHIEADTLFVEYNYTRDDIGNVSSIDLLPAIIPQTLPDNRKDYLIENDNQLTANSLVGENNEETSQAYNYDADGNCISSSGKLEFSAEYSCLNQLTKLVTNNATITIAYDAMNKVKEIDSDGNITKFFYDHKGRLLFETDESNNIKRYYIYKSHRIIAFVENEQSYYPHYDQLGNTLYITNENGNVTNRYIYSAFGEILASEETISYPYTYGGAFGVRQLYTNLYLMHSRLYEANNGLFLQRDPLNFYGDNNTYRFASNNPLTNSDPLGLDDDTQATINAGALDSGYDYESGISEGTADAFNPNLKHSANSNTDPVEILGALYNGVTDSPLGDLIPGNIGSIVSAQKAAKKASEGKGWLEIGWQFVPFNNTMEFIYNEKKKEMQEKSWNYYHMPDGRPKLVAKPYGGCNFW